MRPLDLHLRTDLRSEERRQYEQRRKDKEAEMEGARQQVRIVIYITDVKTLASAGS